MASSALVLNATSDTMSSSLVSSDLLIVDEMTPSDHHHTSPSDLEMLAYSIAMLIVEGRDSAKPLHATPSIDKLVGNMFNLSQQQTEKSAIKKNSKTVSSNHICDESTNQCRLASKIKKNIEKCVGHHHHHHGRLDQVDVVLEDVIYSSSPTSSQLKRRLSNKLKHHQHDHQSVYVLRKQRVDSNNNLRIESNDDHTTSSILVDNDQESLETSSYSEQSCVTIQVFLVPECCHHHIRLEHGDNLIDQDQNKFSGELLERWTITMISEKNNESTVNISKALLSINGLFQAIRSYLHFSQISSWINQSKGSEPKHLAFSVSYTSEKNPTIESRQIIEASSISTDQQQSFEFHSFPTLSLVLLNNRFWIASTSSTTSNTSVRVNNSINLLRSNLIRVGLYSRKRNSFSETITNSIGIPLIPCSLGHQTSIEDTQEELETGESTKSSRSSSLKPSSPPLQQQFYLPHWSTIMMTPGSPAATASGLFRRSSVESSANDNDLAVDLLDEQEKFQKSSTTLALITTPTSFNSSPSFLFKDDSSREEKAAESASVTAAKNFLISQSPKVLVSNHQLDLCTHATNNLKLDEQPPTVLDELACAASKRKLKASFNQTSGNVTHSKKFFTGEDEDTDEQAMDVVSRDEQSGGDDDLIRKLNNNPSVNFKKIGEDDLIKSRLLPRRNYPLSSSPAPLRKSGSAFDFDNSLRNPKSIKNAFCLSKTIDNNNNAVEESVNEENNMSTKQQTVQLSYSNANFNSIQLTPNRLLGSFEESLLNGRMNPVGVVDGFYAEIGASGSFFPEHVTLPVHTAFYQVCEDVAASPYLGVLNLASLGKRGYKVPSKGTIQVTLFNPNNTVVKMFVVMYDLSDMPPGNKTFLRQRTMYVPLLSSTSSSTTTNPTTTSGKISHGGGDAELLKSYLRYLIHLRFATSRSGKMYLHTNIKLIFARNKCEIDPRLAKYEYKTFTEAPRNPKYSPKK